MPSLEELLMSGERSSPALGALEGLFKALPAGAGYFGGQEYAQGQQDRASIRDQLEKQRQRQAQFEAERAALGPGATPEAMSGLALKYAGPQDLLKYADDYQKLAEAKKQREAQQSNLERIMGGQATPPATTPQRSPSAAPSGGLTPVSSPMDRVSQLKQLSVLYADKPAAVTAINREIDKLETGSAPSVHIVQDKTSPTGWSYGDAKKEGKILMKGAPAPASAVDPGNVETNAKAIAEYRQAPLTGFALRSPGAQSIMARVNEINPQYDAKNFATAQRTRNSFAVGVEGRTVRSFNVAIDHLDTLKDAADALKNNDIQRFNQLKQRIAQETGSEAPTNFDAIKGIVAKEIVKSVVGNAQGGGVTERQELSHDMSRVNSPAQLLGMIDKYHSLMAGQLKGLKQQYEGGLGGSDFERFLLPRSKEVFDKSQRVSSAIREFATEADAARAGVKAGERVKVGGQTGTWK